MASDSCESCGATIDSDLRACPECGNEPAAAAKKAALGILVVGLVLSVIIPPIGVLVIVAALFVLLTLWRGWADYSPTSHSF